MHIITYAYNTCIIGYTKKAKGTTLKHKLLRSVGARVLREKSGEIAPEITEAAPKQKPLPVVDVTGDGNKPDALKSSIPWAPGVSGPGVKVN